MRRERNGMEDRMKVYTHTVQSEAKVSSLHLPHQDTGCSLTQECMLQKKCTFLPTDGQVTLRSVVIRMENDEGGKDFQRHLLHKKQARFPHHALIIVSKSLEGVCEPVELFIHPEYDSQDNNASTLVLGGLEPAIVYVRDLYKLYFLYRSGLQGKWIRHDFYRFLYSLPPKFIGIKTYKYRRHYIYVKFW